MLKVQERLPRKEREYRRHRDEILIAAESVFVREGYHAATVEQIARQAEFSVGTIYNFFEGKEDLYVRVLERIALDFLDRLEKEVLSLADPRGAISALIELRLEHYVLHRGFFRVFMATARGSRLDPASALPQSCTGLYDRYLEQVSGLVERMIDGRSNREGEADPLFLTFCLEGIINACTAYWAKNEEEKTLAVVVEKIKNAVFGFILGWSGSESKSR